MAMIGACSLMFCKFRACRAPDFFGKKDPIASIRWLEDISNSFRSSLYPEEAKVRLASYLLKDKAHDWWEEVGYALGGEYVDAMTWDDFSSSFRVEFAPVIEVQQLAREFQDLFQTTETVAGITAMFRDRAFLVPQYVASEEMKKARYHDILKDEIREFLSMSSCNTLDDMIDQAHEQEIELETMRKRKSVRTQVSEGSGTKPKFVDSRSRGHQGCSRCGTYDGVCRMGGSECYKCGKTRHFSRGCPTTPVTFLVNDVLAIVLFDSGATRSFVSLAPSKRFGYAPRELDYPLNVEISDDFFIQVSRVHRGFVLELFSKRYPIYLVPIPLYKIKVEVGTEWLGPNGAMIDCGHQLIMV
ncbi:hypothetical protein Lser_V15G45405 [Lactuca serriola]